MATLRGWKVGFDAAFPLPGERPDGADVVVFYIGGDALNVWTKAQLDSCPERFRWPIWVRSDPAAVTAPADAMACLQALREYGVPKGTAVMLDLEEAINPSYVKTFADVLHHGGYWVNPYGPSSTLFRNPREDGYALAQPSGTPHIADGTVATQWSFRGQFDLWEILDTVPLWDTQSGGPSGPPSGNTEWDDSMRDTIDITSVAKPISWPTGAAKSAIGFLVTQADTLTMGVVHSNGTEYAVKFVPQPGKKFVFRFGDPATVDGVYISGTTAQTISWDAS